MIYGLYTAGLMIATAGYAPVALWRRLAQGVPLNLLARLGVGGDHGLGPAGWVHAVSVGEVITAEPLVAGLGRTYPGLPLVVTTVTATGARVVRDRFAGVATHRFFPFDVPAAVRRVVEAIDPVFLISMETELWPNTLRAVATRGAPIMVANGRLSDRSFRRYRLVRRLLGPMLDHVRVFAMQSEEDARRIVALGARPERVFVTGNLKHESLAPADDEAELGSALLGLRPGQPVWIAGSTHRGEEEAVLEAHAGARATVRDLRLILAPRHPERVPEVARLAHARGWPTVRRTELPVSGSADAVILLDTVGELARLYGVADVVFVGGSLVQAGGHNILEPALRRKPVLFGPHTGNFRDAATLLLERGGGVLVRDAAELARKLQRLLVDTRLRAEIGAAAGAAAASRGGAVRATLELATRFLCPGPRR